MLDDLVTWRSLGILTKSASAEGREGKLAGDKVKEEYREMCPGMGVNSSFKEFACRDAEK